MVAVACEEGDRKTVEGQKDLGLGIEGLEHHIGG